MLIDSLAREFTRVLTLLIEPLAREFTRVLTLPFEPLARGGNSPVFSPVISLMFMPCYL